MWSLFAVITVCFFLMGLTPGGPFDSQAPVPPEILANLGVRSHLDQPLIRQYVSSLWNLPRGDLAPSLKDKDFKCAERDQLYNHPRRPYTRALVAAVPIADLAQERAKRKLVLTGDLPSALNPPSGYVFRTRCPKATELCATAEPRAETPGPGHVVRCHYWRA